VNLSLVQAARIGFSISAVKTPVDLMWIEGKPETARAAGAPVIKGIVIVAALVLGAHVLQRRVRNGVHPPTT
jgi:hypothetical protein